MICLMYSGDMDEQSPVNLTGWTIQWQYTSEAKDVAMLVISKVDSDESWTEEQRSFLINSCLEQLSMLGISVVITTAKQQEN